MSTGDSLDGDSAIILQQELLNDIAHDLMYCASNEWARLDATIVLIGDRAFLHLGFHSGMGEGSSPSIPVSLPVSARRLKEVMYVPGRGTWITLRISIESDGSIESVFEYDERPDLGEEIFRDLFRELDIYPRTLVPEWMVSELGDDLPSVGPVDVLDSDSQDVPSAGMNSALGPSDLYKPEMERDSALLLAQDFVPEEAGLVYFRIVRNYESERDPVKVFLELDDERYEYRKVEVFPNGCVDSAMITCSGEYTQALDDPWPSISELELDGRIIAIDSISPIEFQTEWLIANGPE
ncbi:DUF6881 domain-containing protein [Nocardia sp. NPDC055053]